MCFADDVFHQSCGHWGKPRVYSSCPNTARRGYSRGCWNLEVSGAINEVSLCAECRARYVDSRDSRDCQGMLVVPYKGNEVGPGSDHQQGEGARHSRAEYTGLKLTSECCGVDESKRSSSSWSESSRWSLRAMASQLSPQSLRSKRTSRGPSR